MCVENQHVVIREAPNSNTHVTDRNNFPHSNPVHVVVREMLPSAAGCYKGVVDSLRTLGKAKRFSSVKRQETAEQTCTRARKLPYIGDYFKLLNGTRLLADGNGTRLLADGTDETAADGTERDCWLTAATDLSRYFFFSPAAPFPRDFTRWCFFLFSGHTFSQTLNEFPRLSEACSASFLPCQAVTGLGPVWRLHAVGLCGAQQMELPSAVTEPRVGCI
ncbi:hypothetical protein BaRGS_00030985 [Batillaria attramentaria]|uniref:Uncharacterized protein n=1 Tax=Batillaria attramentaria TaxID=370345 RepID=A0ABD0JS30_9CAEN